MSTFLLGDKGGSWFLRLLGIRARKRVDRRKLIEALIVKIDSSLQEIRDSISRLEKRYKDLVKKAMIAAFFRNERDRALIYANEANEVKKMAKKLKVSEKALEQVKLRFETIENVSNLSLILNEITGILVATKEYVKDVMPNLAVSLDSLANEAKRIIAETTDVDLRTEEGGVYVTPEAKKLLKEIEAMAEESISKNMPDIPASMLTPLPSKGIEVKVKDVSKPVKKPKRPIRKLSPEEIDKAVLEYIITHGGFIDISDVANRLNIDKSEVMASLHRLKEQNKIVF